MASTPLSQVAAEDVVVLAWNRDILVAPCFWLRAADPVGPQSPFAEPS